MLASEGLLQDGDRARPAGRCRSDLAGEARHGEPVVGKYFKIVKLLEVTIADISAGFMPFPDQASITRLLEAVFGVHERCIPTPPVGPGDSDASFQQVHGGLIAHAAAGAHIIGTPISSPGARIDQYNFKRRELMADSAELLFYFRSGNDMSI